MPIFAGDAEIYLNNGCPRCLNARFFRKSSVPHGDG